MRPFLYRSLDDLDPEDIVGRAAFVFNGALMEAGRPDIAEAVVITRSADRPLEIAAVNLFVHYIADDGYCASRDLLLDPEGLSVALKAIGLAGPALLPCWACRATEGTSYTVEYLDWLGGTR